MIKEKDKAEQILDKFNKEMLQGLIKKMFADIVLSEEDLDFAYIDSSIITVDIPIVYFKSKKPGIISKKLNITVSIDISKEEQFGNEDI